MNWYPCHFWPLPLVALFVALLPLCYCLFPWAMLLILLPLYYFPVDMCTVYEGIFLVLAMKTRSLINVKLAINPQNIRWYATR